MGEAWLLLLARRGGRPREAATRSPAFVSEATYSRCQVLPGGYLVSLQVQPGAIWRSRINICYV